MCTPWHVCGCWRTTCGHQFFLTCGFWSSNSGCQTWLQCPSPLKEFLEAFPVVHHSQLVTGAHCQFSRNSGNKLFTHTHTHTQTFFSCNFLSSWSLNPCSVSSPKLFFTFFKKIISFYVDECFTCLYYNVYHMFAWCPRRSDKGVTPPGTAV